MDYLPTPEGKDPQLWNLANRRAAFKRHASTYVIVNTFLWLLWFFNGAKNAGDGLPWPVWPMFGWGIGLVFHYINAYVSTGSNSVEKEYEKLKQKQ
ncbi:MAG TPA: 2TM domain-containing protein [Flavisolibacter sp.]|nr:2TM domain-containing protein [Flavisolibacter sp.]